ncbi:MAG: BRO family protein [Sarcina sp.]
MSNLIIKNFNGYKLHTFIWEGNLCWIASEVAKILNCTNVSKTLSKCIKQDGFEEKIEYEVLRKDRLKNFVNSIKESSNTIVNNKIRNLTILYEDGLYGFLQYNNNDISRNFKKWLRRDLLPKLRVNSQPQIFAPSNIESTNLNIDISNCIYSIQKFEIAYKNIALLNQLMLENNISSEIRLNAILKIYSELEIEFQL